MQSSNYDAPVKLVQLAMELDEPIDSVEQALAGEVFTCGGFRCVSPGQAERFLALRRAEIEAKNILDAMHIRHH